MAITMSPELKSALESDCAHGFEAILKQKTPEDYSALRGIIAGGASVDPGMRSAALFLLGSWGDTAAVGSILAIVPDLDDDELVSAIDALGRLGTPKALKAVIDHADAPSSDVRKFVTHALGRIKTKPALKKLKEMQTGDPTEMVRKSAERILSKNLTQKP